MEEKNNKGGKRIGAGRKPAKDPKKTFVFYIHRSCVLKFGSEERLKEKVYDFLENYEREEIKKSSSNYDATKNDKPTNDKPSSFFKPIGEIVAKKDANYFYQKMKTLDKDDVDAIMKLSEEANDSLFLNFNEKRTIRTALQNGTY